MNISNIKREAVQAALFRCGQCGHAVELPAETLGKKAKCPECGEVSRVGPAEPMIEIIEENDPTPQAPRPTPSRERKAGSQTQEPASEGTDADSLAMSYLGRVQAGRTLEKPIAAKSPALQRCPHCHQVMPTEAVAASAPIALAKPAIASPRPAVVPSRPALAPSRPTVAPAKPSAAPAKPPAAATQRAPRPSELTGRSSSGVIPLRPVGEPTMRCPYCRETILLAARKCKHCGEFLDDTLRCLSEPGGNKRRDSSGRSAPDDSGSNSLQELAYRIGPVKLAIAALVVAGLAYVGVHFLGGRTGVAATPGANPNSAEATLGEDKFSAAKDALSKLTDKLEKQLVGTEVRSAGGSVLTFENSDKGVAPWASELIGSGKNLKGRVTIPYKMESSENLVSSDRGVFVLELSSKNGGLWELKVVQKQPYVRIKNGAETPIPGEDRNFYPQKDADFAVVHFKKTLSKVAPPPTDS